MHIFYTPLKCFIFVYLLQYIYMYAFYVDTKHKYFFASLINLKICIIYYTFVNTLHIMFLSAVRRGE